LHPRVLQFARYVLVGGFNTVFGYGLFALLNWSLSRVMPWGYLVATLLSSLIAITVAFLGYKWIVFRTKGNYLREWLRCMGVYGTSMVISFIAMAIFVPVARRHMQHPQQASYAVGAAVTLAMVFISFLGHKNISFRNHRGAEFSAKI
jgi:putative flippase GtrA